MNVVLFISWIDGLIKVIEVIVIERSMEIAMLPISKTTEQPSHQTDGSLGALPTVMNCWRAACVIWPAQSVALEDAEAPQCAADHPVAAASDQDERIQLLLSCGF